MALAIVMIKRVLETQPLFWITSLRMLGAVIGMMALAALRGEWAALHRSHAPVPWRRLLLAAGFGQGLAMRSEEHTSELQSLMRISYAVFCLKNKKNNLTQYSHT